MWGLSGGCSIPIPRTLRNTNLSHQKRGKHTAGLDRKGQSAPNRGVFFLFSGPVHNSPIIAHPSEASKGDGLPMSWPTFWGTSA